MEYLKLLIPAFLTLGGNALFYKYIKMKSEQSIQKYTIAYSGIFMERIKVYRGLLESIFDLKHCIQQHIGSDKKEPEELIRKFNSFVRDCKINEPLLSEKLSENLRKLDLEFRGITQETIHSIEKKSKQKGSRDFNELIKSAQKDKEIRDKLLNSKTLKNIETNLLNDMKNDFAP